MVSEIVQIQVGEAAGLRVRGELRRRLEALREARRIAALSPGDEEAFLVWLKARDRGDKISGVLIAHLSGREFITSLRSAEAIRI